MLNPRKLELGFDRKDDTLELAFNSKPLRTLCESEALAEGEWGVPVAKMLRRRLSDLRAATSTKDILVGRPRILDGTDGQHMVVELCNGYRIVFCANHPKNPMTEAGKPDWAKVSRIKILQIESEHGD